MRNRRLLLGVLVVLIVLSLVLTIGVVFLKLNSTPDKIFKNAVSKVFEKVETAEEQYSTMKGNINLTAGIESENEEVQSIKDMLEDSNVEVNIEADTKDFKTKGDLNIKVNNENLLNASILLQDEKGYIYLPDWLDKYIELPEEYIEYSNLTEYYDKIATLDQEKLMNAIETELILAISKQELLQENTTLVLNGQETKVTASTLSLKNEQIANFYKEFFGNLNKNENFQIGLGVFKEDVQSTINEMLLEIEEIEDIGLEVTIYTKGFLNEFVGISGKSFEYYFDEATGFSLLKHNSERYEFISYSEDEGERQEEFNITVEDKKESKNKGTATITMTVEEQQIVAIYNYEKQNNQTFFGLSAEIEGVVFGISGNAVENGKNVKGVLVISLQEETLGKINLNCAYDFSYGAEIQKVDTGNAILIDELSEEDKTTFITNVSKSPLYKFIEQVELNYSLNKKNTPEVKDGGYIVKYNIPDGFDASNYNSDDQKAYMDENFNSINVMIEPNSVNEYLNSLQNEYVLTSEYYKNKSLSSIMDYNVNGKAYKLRTITYEDDYSSYVNLYFVYELEDKYCYVVEVETEGGNISLDKVKYFLDVTVDENSIQNAIDSERELGRGDVYINGVGTVNVNDILNTYTSDN